jgi:hypothetical protein
MTQKKVASKPDARCPGLLYSSENVQQQIDPDADVRDCFVER